MTNEEQNVEVMRSQLVDIKDALHDIEKDMKIELGKFSVQFHEFSIVISSVLVKLEERDRRFQELITDNKETFNRFGNEIKTLRDDVHKLDLKSQSIKTLERIVYGTATATGGLFIWFLQRSLGL